LISIKHNMCYRFASHLLNWQIVKNTSHK
jgi:hypothetical protein